MPRMKRYNQSRRALVAHLEEIVRRQAEAGSCLRLVTDLGHWARMGILTVADYERDQDLEWAKEARKAAMAGDWSEPEYGDDEPDWLEGLAERERESVGERWASQFRD